MATWRRTVLVLGTAILLCAAGAAAQASGGWLTSYKEATAQAKKANKPILVDFTGSDWCTWCKKLHSEVFDMPAFAKWAAENVILLECDFPHGQQPPEAIKTQNADLAQKYHISGFPTILFIDAEGNELGRSGYLKGGAESWVESATKILANRPKPPEVELAASLTEAMAKAKAKNRPLLLLTTSSGEGAKSAETLTKDPNFIRLANVHTVTVLVKLPLAADSDEAKAHADLVKSFKVFATQGVALLDVAATKVLYRAPGVAGKPELVVAELKKVMPPLKYDGSWLENFALAEELSAQLKRPILMDFTGTDWCPWCIKLDKEVFSTETFQKFAADNLVLMKCDFLKKTEQPAALKQQNEALGSKFHIQGFPTALLYYGGKTIGQFGYQPGGPEPFIAAVQKSLSAKSGK